MNSFLTEIRQTLVPDHNGNHGPLPPLLVALTLVTGLVDAFSYLVLGHVFVANMTGNVVLLGFAVIGVPGFSILASVIAITSFSVGALVGGLLGSRLGHRRDHLLSFAASIQAVLITAAVVSATLSGSPVQAGYRYSLIAVLAGAMGIQNAAARKLAVPDLTTTVLTLTITGVAADSSIAGGSGSRSGRRLISVGAMLAGAVVGAALVVHSHIYYPLVIALVVIAGVAASTLLLATPEAPWVGTES
jgi:uncharacterized membrane protein YoaK (UPF0700 family)